MSDRREDRREMADDWLLEAVARINAAPDLDAVLDPGLWPD